MGAESRRLGRWLRLGAVLPLIGILVLHTSQIEATTWRAVTKTCPLDGTEVTNFVPGSTYISDLTPDFRPLGVGVDWFLSAYIMCPTCGFTARYEAFDDTEGLDRTRVLEALRRLEASSLFRERDSAIAVEMNWHNDPHVLAHLALGAKWLADDTGDPAIIQDRLGRAIEAHKTALAHEGFAAEQKPHYLYLIGELLRQKGEREEAIKWFDRAREAGDERIRGLAEQQRLLAVYQDKPVEQPLAAVAQGTPDEKVKAIGMLRGLEDEKVLTFLKDVVLRCPERLREQAIRGLLEGGARRYHLPIYLEALTSDHFRTVQGGATAVQQLRATEAAPLLLKALEHPVADTEYRLRKALAMLATENELDGLSRLVDGLDPDAALGMKIDLLRALLNTGSDGAIPPIVRLLQADEQLIRSVGYGDDILESAAVFGPDLLGKLIEAAGEEFAPTLQRVRAEVERKTADLPEGAAYVPVDLDLAFQEREIDYKLMFPAERQQSFETVMARVKEDDESHRRELEQVLAELAAMGPEERESSRAVDQLARLRQEYYRSEWLAELGMTRDERAIAVLMEHLEHANCHVRAEAVKGLMYLYDEEIGDRLAARLLDEEPLVQSVIVFVIGNAADARHVDALVALAHEPTLVRTKLGWVRTMEALSPERAKPVLEYWVTSPDKTLAGAAREALGRLGQAARREQ